MIIALLMLTGCETVTSGFSDTSKQLSDFTGRMFGNASGKTPRKAAVRMEDQSYPDERRQGLNELVKQDFGKRAPYTTRYVQIAGTDDDWLVRATAIRALNRSRDRDATAVFVKSLSDPNDQVRLEAAKALVHMPDDSAVPALVKIVQDTDENHDVRIAAADALQHYRTLEAARALTTTLGGRDFGVAWQAHQTLTKLTQRDMQYDEAAWLAYLTGPEKPFG
ncbi:MAG TPA: HEAT repeat domain-containing protein [Tepidisphaeraceae bacterium]|nr:HEAT repeat domain-containing protein [Tepidisphaeraceae bacterium]